MAGEILEEKKAIFDLTKQLNELSVEMFARIQAMPEVLPENTPAIGPLAEAIDLINNNKSYLEATAQKIQDIQQGLLSLPAGVRAESAEILEFSPAPRDA